MIYSKHIIKDIGNWVLYQFVICFFSGIPAESLPIISIYDIYLAFRKSDLKYSFVVARVGTYFGWCLAISDTRDLEMETRVP